MARTTYRRNKGKGKGTSRRMKRVKTQRTYKRRTSNRSLKGGFLGFGNKVNPIPPPINELIEKCNQKIISLQLDWNEINELIVASCYPKRIIEYGKDKKSCNNNIPIQNLIKKQIDEDIPFGESNKFKVITIDDFKTSNDTNIKTQYSKIENDINLQGMIDNGQYDFYMRMDQLLDKKIADKNGILNKFSNVVDRFNNVKGARDEKPYNFTSVLPSQKI